MHNSGRHIDFGGYLLPLDQSAGKGSVVDVSVVGESVKFRAVVSSSKETPLEAVQIIRDGAGPISAAVAVKNVGPGLWTFEVPIKALLSQTDTAVAQNLGDELRRTELHFAAKTADFRAFFLDKSYHRPSI